MLIKLPGSPTILDKNIGGSHHGKGFSFLGAGPKWARAHMGQGPNGLGLKWARAQKGQGLNGPGPKNGPGTI